MEQGKGRAHPYEPSFSCGNTFQNPKQTLDFSLFTPYFIWYA